MDHDPGAELVDIVDDQGRTAGVTTRRDIRARRLPHRCVYVLVFNRRGELFIHLRTASKDVYPSHWDVAVGGVLAAGESYAEGVAREVKEELGVETAVEQLFPFRYGDEHSVAWGMVYRAEHEGPFHLQPEEIVRGEFVPVAEALRRAEKDAFCPDGLEVLRQWNGAAKTHSRI